MKNQLQKIIPSILVLTMLTNTAQADKVCMKASLKNSKVSLSKRTISSARNCPRGYTEVVNTTTLVGPTGATGSTGASGATGATGAAGATGATGANGSLRIYGDGSAGALAVTSTTTLTASNTQFTDITIDPSVTLTVPSGTVLRCTGTFTLNGAISVDYSGLGAIYETSSVSNSKIFANRPAVIGHALSAPQNGEFGSDANILYGGQGVTLPSMSEAAARYLVNPGKQGGAGGGAGYGSSGGRAGGVVTVICQGAINIGASGSISASGSSGISGGGGGAGGIVILASQTSITNSGSVSANGGSGAFSTVNSGAGGGGGGGIVHFISPSITAGTRTVTGGAAGSTFVTVSSSDRMGGSAGGSCAGAGGNGSDVSSSGSGNTQSGVTAGLDGFAISTSVDPTSLF